MRPLDLLMAFPGDPARRGADRGSGDRHGGRDAGAGDHLPADHGPGLARLRHQCPEVRSTSTPRRRSGRPRPG